VKDLRFLSPNLTTLTICHLDRSEEEWRDLRCQRSTPSHFRKGGEMLTEFNCLGFRFVGMIMVIFAGYLLYMPARDIIAR
jgi:hypothetical protein